MPTAQSVVESAEFATPRKEVTRDKKAEAPNPMAMLAIVVFMLGMGFYFYRQMYPPPPSVPENKNLQAWKEWGSGEARKYDALLQNSDGKILEIKIEDARGTAKITVFTQGAVGERGSKAVAEQLFSSFKKRFPSDTLSKVSVWTEGNKHFDYGPRQ